MVGQIWGALKRYNLDNVIEYQELSRFIHKILLFLQLKY